MTAVDDDPIFEGLAGLQAAPGRSFVDTLFASWVRVGGPIGDVFVAYTDHGMSLIRTAESVDDNLELFIEVCHERTGRPVRASNQPPPELTESLASGDGSRLPVDLRGATEFQLAVLRVTRLIPHGQTRPYSWVAVEIGRPQSARAVVSALGTNPVPLVVPCHRAIRSDGGLGEYVFGPAHKDTLLRVEDANVDEVAALGRAGIHFLADEANLVVCFTSCQVARAIPAPARHGFGTVDEALAAGFSACGVCQPQTMATG